MADDVLYSGVRGVTDLMVMPGLINLDFADVRAVMAEMGKAMMGTGEAEGEGRAIEAAEAAISNPLLDEVSMKGARGVLINISGGPDMTLYEVDEAANRIRDEVDSQANIIFGSIFDEALEGSVRVSVVATGIDAEEQTQPQPQLHTLYPELVGAQQTIENDTTLAPVRPAQAPLAFSRPPAAPAATRPLIVPQEARPMGPAVAKSLAETVTATATAQAATIAMPDPQVAPQVVQEQPATQTVSLVDEPRPIEVRAKIVTPAHAIAPAHDPKAGATPAREPFIPPRAAAAARRETLAKPDPFAEAALSNAGVEQPKKSRRGPSLFERMTGGGRTRKQAQPADEKVWDMVLAKEAGDKEKVVHTEPRLEAKPARPSPQTTAKQAVPVVSPPLAAEKEGVKKETPAEPQATPAPQGLALEPEEDLLEIPAFLRRQAN